MFEYSLTVLQALNASRALQSVAAYAHPAWAEQIEAGVQGVPLRHTSLGLGFSHFLLALHVPCSVSRRLAPLNPVIRQLRQLDCDVWIFPSQEPLAYQMPHVTIGTIHDLMHRYERGFPESGSFLRFRMREHRFQGIARNASLTLVDSELGKSQVLDSYDAEPSTIFPLPFIAPSYVRRASSHPVPSGLPSKFLFYPAQFWPHKNHERLLRAVAALRDELPDICLVLSGHRTREHSRLQSLAAKLSLEGQIHFVGRVPPATLVALYKAARALIMPTFYGPTNIPPLEAHSLGCPVIISDRYAMREQCRDAALYIDPTSIEDIADKIRMVWSDDSLAAELASAGFRLAEENNFAAFSHRLERAILQTLNSNRRIAWDANQASP